MDDGYKKVVMICERWGGLGECYDKLYVLDVLFGLFVGKNVEVVLG